MEKISALFLACSAMCLIVSWWCARRRQQQPTQPTTATWQQETLPPEPEREIFLDESHYALVGPRWKWEFDQPAMYCCPRCASPQGVNIRAYSHVSDGRIYAILRHDCEGEPRTDALAFVGEGEQLL